MEKHKPAPGETKQEPHSEDGGSPERADKSSANKREWSPTNIFLRDYSVREQIEGAAAVEIDGERVKVVDISPEKLKTETPLLVAPGWAATPKFLQDNIEGFVRGDGAGGRRTLCLDTPHGVDLRGAQGGSSISRTAARRKVGQVSRQETAEDYLTEETISEAELRKVAAAVKVMEEKGISQVDVVAHSEAGINMLLAAALYPEKFRNIVLVNPAGLMKKDNTAALATRFSYDNVRRTLAEVASGFPGGKRFAQRTNTAGLEIIKSVAKNPLRSLKEVVAIANTHTGELIDELKTKGVRVSIIHTTKDRAFPIQRVKEMASAREIDEFYTIEGGHGELMLNAEKVTDLADRALISMEKKARMERIKRESEVT
ncbi:MAG: alpha/beta fold hydrolase [Candidatus Liptonbacteria bacterium]